jgi:hypothetical protein
VSTRLDSFEPLTEIRFQLDRDDIRDVKAAIDFRLNSPLGKELGLPDGGGDLDSGVLGEICRGWMGQFPDSPVNQRMH